jgi:hypothetical protein
LRWLDEVGLTFACAGEAFGVWPDDGWRDAAAFPWLCEVGSAAFACAFALPRRLSLLSALFALDELSVLLAEVALSPAFGEPSVLRDPALPLLDSAPAVLSATLPRSLVLVPLFPRALLPLPPALPRLPSAWVSP